MDFLNSEWTITVVGGIISTVVGTLVANGIQNSSNQSRYSTRSGGIFENLNGFQIIGFFAIIAVLETIWIYVLKDLMYPYMPLTFGEFGAIITFFLWVAGAAAIPHAIFAQMQN